MRVNGEYVVLELAFNMLSDVKWWALDFSQVASNSPHSGDALGLRVVGLAIQKEKIFFAFKISIFHFLYFYSLRICIFLSQETLQELRVVGREIQRGGVGAVGVGGGWWQWQWQGVGTLVGGQPDLRPVFSRIHALNAEPLVLTSWPSAPAPRALGDPPSSTPPLSNPSLKRDQANLVKHNSISTDLFRTIFEICLFLKAFYALAKLSQICCG